LKQEEFDKTETISLAIPLKFREGRGILELCKFTNLYSKVDDLDDSSSIYSDEDSECSQKLRYNILYSLSLQDYLINQSLILEERDFKKKLKKIYRNAITKLVSMPS
jgi:hypothetical protein